LVTFAEVDVGGGLEYRRCPKSRLSLSFTSISSASARFFSFQLFILGIQLANQNIKRVFLENERKYAFHGTDKQDFNQRAHYCQ